MEIQKRILIAAVVVLSTLAALVFLAPTLDEKLLQPQPVRAWVAIEAKGSGVAEIGVVKLAAGTGFILHAVLEATARNGKPVYYTEAPALRFLGPDGERAARIPASALRRWDRRPVVKVRWFTVEGRQPFLPFDLHRDGDPLPFETFFRGSWPSHWSIPGTLEPAFDDGGDLGSRLEPAAQDFGTQRYHVRIELYRDPHALLPEQRFPSSGPEALLADSARFPTVVAELAGAAGPASAVFGLTEIEAPPAADSSTRAAIARLVRRHLAFTRLSVLRDLIDLAGAQGESWRSLDFGTAPVWQQSVDRGDLLRAGARVVVLYADRGKAGVLDYEDLCFDFVAGARVRAIGDVFSGEDPVLEHLALARPIPQASGGI